MLFSIKSFVNKISPLDIKEGFLYYRTSKYMLHYLETPSGLKFILNTDNSSQDVRELLQQIYSQVRKQFDINIYCFVIVSIFSFQIYVEYVVKNPLCKMQQPIQSELFKTKLDAFIKQHPISSLKSSQYVHMYKNKINMLMYYISVYYYSGIYRLFIQYQ